MTTPDTAPAAAGVRRPSILFVDKVFLKQTPEALRGVELFNLHLLRDLMELGYPTTLVAEPSWTRPVRDFLQGRALDAVWVPSLGSGVLTALRAGSRLGGRRFDHLLLGNVGDGLIPFMWWLRRRGAFRRCVLIANREASPRFVRFFRSVPGAVVAVNRKIASPFRAAGMPDVHVDYGVFDGDRYAPPEARAADPIRFVLLGALDNAWKGADTAIAAFRRMPPGARARCELHLASYARPPAQLDAGIVAYAWMPSADIPDFLRRMDVMLCPSRDEEVMRETFSQAMVQGMLSGLPIVVSDLPILKEKLDAGGGLVFRSVEELAGHMARLADDPALRARLGREARETALARYVWDTRRFADRYLAPGGDV